MAAAILPPDPLVEELVRSMNWVVVSEGEFREMSHVNLQESNVIRHHLMRLCNLTTAPLRCVNVSDSLVGISAWAKGRSSSFKLNGLLRRALPWGLFGRKSLVNLHIGTKTNPADDPSRHVLLRSADVPDAWMVPLLVGLSDVDVDDLGKDIRALCTDVIAEDGWGIEILNLRPPPTAVGTGWWASPRHQSATL